MLAKDAPTLGASFVEHSDKAGQDFRRVLGVRRVLFFGTRIAVGDYSMEADETGNGSKGGGISGRRENRGRDSASEGQREVPSRLLV